MTTSMTLYTGFFTVFLSIHLIKGFSSDPAFVTWQVNQFNATPIVDEIDANKDNIITLKEIANLNKVLDLNKDGVIRRCEYITASAPYVDPRFAEWEFDAADFDHNNVLFTNETEIAVNDGYTRNKDGVITREELAEFLRQQVRNASLAQYMAINGPLRYDKDEYNLKFEDILSNYASYDSDKDGFVSKNEFLLSLGRLSTSRCLFIDVVKSYCPVSSESLLSKWFTEVDKNGDNKLDISDTDAIYPEADTNKDGKVSVYEIGFWDYSKLTVARWRMGLPYIYVGEVCKDKLPYRGYNMMIFATDFDYNKDGKATTQELVRHFHEQWDRNWDGIMDYEEFEYKFVHRFGGTKEQAKLQYPCDDYNNDGIVTLDDYPFELWDRNHNGVVDFCDEVLADIYRVSSRSWKQLLQNKQCGSET